MCLGFFIFQKTFNRNVNKVSLKIRHIWFRSQYNISFVLFSPTKHRKLKLELKAESQEGQAELSQAASIDQLIASYLQQAQPLVLTDTWTCLGKRCKTRGVKRHLRTQAFHPE